MPHTSNEAIQQAKTLVMANTRQERLADSYGYFVDTEPFLLQHVGFLAFLAPNGEFTVFEVEPEQASPESIGAEMLASIHEYLGTPTGGHYHRLHYIVKFGPLQVTAVEYAILQVSPFYTTFDSLTQSTHFEALRAFEEAHPTPPTRSNSPEVAAELDALQQAGLPLPTHEKERLEALYATGILDSLPEHEFDILTELASYVCGTPMAAITLIDAGRQWVKSAVGVDANETRRADSFCQFTINQPADSVFEVEDATQDDRFRENPYVLGDPNIRFYAGAPLQTASGHNIGSLCVFSDKPMRITEPQRQRLQIMAREVMHLINMRRKAEELEAQNAALDAKLAELTRANRHISALYQDLDDSITYAQRIQVAVLPKVSALARNHPGHFFINRPKHRLTGDFFWAYAKRNVTYLALADCTGHGVPGALLTMLGNNLLNRIHRDYTDLALDLWLAELDQLFCAALGQGFGDNAQQDGMEIALVRIDAAAKTLSFAGAGRHLYLFQNGELRETKGEKLPIGGTQHANKTFVRHELTYAPTDRLFLFSDGVVDLFGGPRLRRLGTKAWLEMLANAQNLPIAEQHATLCQALDGWQGKLEQEDDITVLGVEL